MGLLQTRLVSSALQMPWVVKLLKLIVPPLDKFLLRLSRGWVNTAMQSVVLLEVTGAKSGKRRSVATLCMPDGKDIILVGSNWGQEKHPAWLFNLRANPEAKVTYRGYRGPVHALELHGDERETMWQRLLAFNPPYGNYQASTSRQLPVIRLRRGSTTTTS
jgi:deazaflavin-dependent oxidoreductase (nitroreductase family)